MFGQQQNPIRGNTQQVCAFYLKGQCKYGTQCWNLHQPSQGGAVGGMANTFGVSSNVFGAKTGPQPDSKEFTEFAKQVSGEMTQWERSGLWLLSSFTPLRSHPLLAGFSDHSPEELRCKAYDALKTNTSSAYQEHWSKLQQQYKQLRDALRVPTPDAFQAMQEVFHAKGAPEQQQLQNASQAGDANGLFGKPSVFGANTTQPPPGAGLLGAKPQPSLFGGGGGGSLFGGNQSTPPNMFGDSAKKSLFGATPALGSQNTGSFGAQPSSSPFGGGGNNLFKSGTSTAIGGGSVFGGPPKMQGNTMFGGGSAASPSTPTPGSIFGAGGAANTTPASGGIFGGGTSSNAGASGTGNMFGGGTSAAASTQGANSMFGGNPSSSSTPATGNLFGGGTNTVTITPTPAAGSVFGGGQNQTSSIFGGSNQNPTSTFGGMGAAPTSSASVFGNANTGGASANPFGTQPPLFGVQPNQPQQQQTTPSLFGNPPSSAPGIFGAPPQTTDAQGQNTAPSIFGGNTAPTFGSGTAAAPTFGGGTAAAPTFGGGTAAAPTFGSGTAAAPTFGGGTTGTPTFGSGATLNPSGGTGLFGNAPAPGMQSGSIFGNTSASTGGAPGLFGKAPESQQTLQSTAGSQMTPTLATSGTKVLANVKAEWFTPLEQLDPTDKGQFEADMFTSIPLCPPPLELCF